MTDMYRIMNERRHHFIREKAFRASSCFLLVLQTEQYHVQWSTWYPCYKQLGRQRVSIKRLLGTFKIWLSLEIKEYRSTLNIMLKIASNRVRTNIAYPLNFQQVLVFEIYIFHFKIEYYLPD